MTAKSTSDQIASELELTIRVNFLEALMDELIATYFIDTQRSTTELYRLFERVNCQIPGIGQDAIHSQDSTQTFMMLGIIMMERQEAIKEKLAKQSVE